MDHLAFHRHGSLLSFTVLLSPPNEFEDGGTIFDALVDVAIPDRGPTTQPLRAIPRHPPHCGRQYLPLHRSQSIQAL